MPRSSRRLPFREATSAQIGARSPQPGSYLLRMPSWVVTAWSDFTGWGGWKWDGWGAMGAIGAFTAALAALVTVFFFWRQLSQMRRDATTESDRSEKAWRRSLTPVLSVTGPYHEFTPSPETQEKFTAEFKIHADGRGEVYNLILNLACGPDAQSRDVQIATWRFMRAGDVMSVTVKWDRWEVGSPFALELLYTGSLHELLGWRLSGVFMKPAGIRPDYPPVAIPARDLTLAEAPSQT
jgi:hypothetical protein